MAKKKKTKPTNPEVVQAAGEAALQDFEAVMAAAGLSRLFMPIRWGIYQLGHVAAKKPKTCAGCPPMPEDVANAGPAAWRAYLIIRSHTEKGGYILAKEIMRLSKTDGHGPPLSTRTLGRGLKVLKVLGEIHNEPGKGFRYGSGSDLFSAT